MSIQFNASDTSISDTSVSDTNISNIFTYNVNNVFNLSNNIALFTTLKLSCIANNYYSINCFEDIAPVMRELISIQQTFKVLGGGSNILCVSKQLNTVLSINIKGITLLKIEDDAFIIQVGAGEIWHDVVMYTLQQGWLGLENLALIPGFTGAAPVQNIGAYGVELSDYLHTVQAWDIQDNSRVNISGNECAFAYRDSIFKQTGRYVITYITLKLPRAWQAKIHYGELAQHNWTQYDSHQTQAIAIANLVINIRQRKLPDPSVIANAGSFFKNPIVSDKQIIILKNKYPIFPYYPHTNNTYKLAAGWLIETAGWKGYCRTTALGGRIGVHSTQALVLVHFGGASGDELLQLADDIQNSVFIQFGVLLEREVNVW
ncbi:MAG: UDP-N-acetylenolpyruvoylglucosamine reductase [Pseudomonadota bacterium]|jgi:UDP-N-acetylmuramate dehydrogenase